MKHYSECATRLEFRGDHPPSREEVDRHVADLAAAGVEATWHSAVDYESRPLFPSKAFPDHHPQASLEAFHYLIRRVHELGLPIMSWYALNAGGGMLRSHPEWQIEVMPHPKPADPDKVRRHACYNSPYGELLPKFCVEVVTEVGFDGLWFDGAVYGLHSNDGGNPGCVCERCRARFKCDTGHALPDRVDWDSRVFKEWIRWRYDVFMGIWKSIIDAVHAVRPEAPIAFNNYRRRVPSGHCWQTGIPMRRLGWKMVSAGEIDLFTGQADAQVKYYNAFGCSQGTETWRALCDHWNMWVPDLETLPVLQTVLGCISAGGVASCGVGVKLSLVKDVLRKMQEAAAPRMAFLGGETVEYAAVVASQQTMDFAGRDDPISVWDQLHGANELCRHAHLQTSWIFDDHLAEGGEALRRYPVILLGDMACVSDQQAQKLEDYVRSGGVLVACDRAGTLDEWGERRSRGALDDLLGIASRSEGHGQPTLHVLDPTLRAAAGVFVSFQAPHLIATPTRDATILANCIEVIDRRMPAWELLEDRRGGASTVAASPGLWRRTVGKGTVIYCCIDLFGGYLAAPTVQIMRLVKQVLTAAAMPRVTLDGPMAVTVNTRRQPNGRLAVHLHNAPGSLHSHVVCSRGYGLYTPGEVNPVLDLKLRLHGMTAKRAESPITGQSFRITGGTVVALPRLDLHDVVLITV